MKKLILILMVTVFLACNDHEPKDEAAAPATADTTVKK